MSEEIETVCSRMMVAFQSKVPHLGPQIVPKGYNDHDLEIYCRNNQEKERLKEMIEKERKKASQCSICKSSESNPIHFTSIWSLDLGLKTFTLDNLSILCDSCRILVDLNSVLEMFSSPKREKELKELIRFWGIVNKFDYHEYLDNQSSSSSSTNEKNQNDQNKKKKKEKRIKAQISTDGMESILQQQFQEAYSLAYSIQVISGNLGAFKVLDNSGSILNDETDVIKLVEKYLGNSNGEKKKVKGDEKKGKIETKEKVKTNHSQNREESDEEEVTTTKQKKQNNNKKEGKKPLASNSKSETPTKKQKR
eukprot:TRINITY_DN2234_c2_g1_i2.p1 TRINITY_DN2234_c2_g1~~TRINITY_DN2234_c2_g1_i2.p1  ORF type:complete len:308 (+),score=141.61 TRINITY_DN2234_c2_g1_i2:97-1020(+)